MKAVKEIERKYYKYQYRDWTQPVLLNNASYGLITASNNSDTAYKAFNNSGTTLYSPVGSSLTYIWEFPDFVEFSQSSIGVVYIANVCTSPGAYNVYANQNGDWVEIGARTGGGGLENTTWNIELTSLRTDKIKVVITSQNAVYYSGFKNISFSGYEIVANESTEEDYDFYEDVEVYKLPKGIARKYYKYQYSDFIQPVLTANGVLGSDSFAIEGANYSTSYTYLAFDGKNNTWWVPLIYKTATITDTHLVMYNPLPLNITNFEITNRTYAGLAPVRGEVFVSDDNINYVSLGTWENDNQTSGGVWNIPLEHDGYYKYYKIQFYEWLYNSAGGRSMAECKITATQREVIDGTESNYDIYKDFDIYYGIGD